MEANSDWLFLTTHGTVLLSIAGDPTIGISDLARLAGVAERATKEIVADLVDEGYVVRRREGPRTRYEISRKAHLRHPLFEDLEIGPLIDALQGKEGAAKDRLTWCEGAQRSGSSAVTTAPAPTGL
jgi:hypothetical protein